MRAYAWNASIDKTSVCITAWGKSWACPGSKSHLWLQNHISIILRLSTNWSLMILTIKKHGTLTEWQSNIHWSKKKKKEIARLVSNIFRTTESCETILSRRICSIASYNFLNVPVFVHCILLMIFDLRQNYWDKINKINCYCYWSDLCFIWCYKRRRPSGLSRIYLRLLFLAFILIQEKNVLYVII